MTFESLSKYTEESIKSAKELQKFIHAKAQLDVEYALKLSNNSQISPL
jgi:Fes/CIP4, and EFC/F-BAR homology domain